MYPWMLSVLLTTGGDIHCIDSQRLLKLCDRGSFDSIPKVTIENQMRKDNLCKAPVRAACASMQKPFPFYHCIAFDERMVASKSRSGLKQYMKNMPTVPH